MKESLTAPEWVIMEALWNGSPMFLSEIMAATKDSLAWAASSYATYIKKLTDKGFITYTTVSGLRRYSALVNREACVKRESKFLAQKMTKDSRKLLLVSMLEDYALSDEEKEALRELIEKLTAEE